MFSDFLSDNWEITDISLKNKVIDLIINAL